MLKPVIRLFPKIATLAQQCPSQMHQVIWSTSNSSTRVRIFNRNASSYFNPRVGDGRSGLHHFTFQISGFPRFSDSKSIQSVDDGPKRFPKFEEVILRGPNEYLFIPRTHITSFLSEDLTDVSGHFLARICFVDASNLNSFRDFLKISSLVSNSDDILLRHLQSPSFDFDMRMNPTGRSWSTLRESNDSEVPEDDVNTSNKPKVKASRSRRNRSTGGFRDWQDVKRWDKLITSLTIPAPNVPQCANVGRRNMT